MAGLERTLETKFREEWIARRANWLAARATNRDLRARLRDETAQRAAATAELAFIDEDVKAIDREIERLTTAIAEHDARTGRKELAQTAIMADQAAQWALSEFRGRVENIQRLRPLLAMYGCGFDEFIPSVAKLLGAAKNAEIGAVADELSAAEQGFVSSAPAWSAKVDEARQAIMAEASKLRAQRGDLLERIRQHASEARARISSRIPNGCASDPAKGNGAAGAVRVDRGRGP
ncbi:hypothetical protein [Bradyrhizobium sp. RDI18]|uniref:hypothetical protein n=1 Tax=Bradyrhizobium sp. RDI18 TaxID=3367400 RepID=UPI0037191D9E